jgi:SAM-dependent methyltransferase
VHDPYGIDARYYDTVHADLPDDDIGLWLSFAGRTDRPVLEVGAGTGRIAIELAAAGHRVTALDPSPAMLALARERATDRRLTLEVVEGAAENTPLPADTFGLALVPADVFLYCRDGEAQLAMLRALAPVLHFNGKLILDLPGPAAWLDPSLNGQLLLAWRGTGPDDAPLEVWHCREDDLALQTRTLTVRYETVAEEDGSVRRETTTHVLRYVYRFEVEYLLALAGLCLEDTFGDYELGALTGESERMIVVARRAAG